MREYKTKAEVMQSALKAVGITRRQVSCSMHNRSITAKIKDLSIDPEIVKQVGYQFESYQRDQYSGEILCGGNTFVFVEYDRNIERTITASDEFKAFQAELENKLNGLTDSQCAEYGTALFYRENGNIRLRYDKGDTHEVEPYHNIHSLAWSLHLLVANGTVKVSN
jgi:hypothetical protein